MAGLSSTMRMRRLRGASISAVRSNTAVTAISSSIGNLLLLCPLFRLHGQIESERRTASRSLAAHGQEAEQLTSGESRAVQAEAVARLAGCEPMIEDPGQVLCNDTNTIVRYAEPDPDLQSW